MIAGLFILMGVLGCVVLGVLRNGKRREEAWEEFWVDDVPPEARAKQKGGRS